MTAARKMSAIRSRLKRFFYPLSIICVLIIFIFAYDFITENALWDFTTHSPFVFGLCGGLDNLTNGSNFITEPSTGPIADCRWVHDPNLIDIDPPCGYLFQLLAARLGNHMFGYAGFYAMVKWQRGRTNKTTFLMASDNRPSPLYDVFEHISLPQVIVNPRWLRTRNFNNEFEGPCCTFDSKWRQKLACDGKNVLVGGFRQSYKYFLNDFSDIRREFTFKSKIREECKLLLNRMLAQRGLNLENAVSVGVHLRRGDFTYRTEIKVGHWPVHPDYLKRAIRFYEKWFYMNNTKAGNKSVAFLIVGDDKRWNRKMLKDIELLRPQRTHLILSEESSEAAVDMCLVSSSDNAIISTGTFSWWCGFFNKGMVTYQKEYIRPGSSLEAEFVREDFVLPHWIPL